MRAEHALRRAVVAEMHLRRWPRLCAPASVIQYLRLVGEGEAREAERVMLGRLAGGEPPAPGQRHLIGTVAPGVRFCWERHSEATTFTLFLEGSGPALAMRGDSGLAGLLDAAEALPGEVMRATRVVLVEDEAAAGELLPGLGFLSADLVSCHVGGPGMAGPGARIWSDFALRDDGFGVLLVAANGLRGHPLARAVQGLQELGNYRNLALLGLPVAREGWAALDGIERGLEAVSRDMARPEVTDDALLEEVSALSLRLVAHGAASDFRMGAAEAYAAIVEERLAGLAVRPVPDHLSLADFTQRRLLPAVRTCAAHRRRAEQLAERLARFVSLLRTRIETRIENQNGRLLASMERNSARQLRLQQLVEGLSVVALSYYAISLVGHVLDGAEAVLPGVHAGPWLAVLTPCTVAGVWLGLHVLKRRVLD
ncbi:DUF3422 domain-containing protein [Novosphingobium flavum]|uniref:DUF3422 domain-containing protein n=1 Tax=Novosphingobium flavum TaxID=1778672 RepID=A0A7X1KL20_9SPHN|nr:DUF3422 domain-containing protein [Novosphingobium flavum]MBC2665144.1 DUF3422 domain-containing protein [Novosphingobium flavum]